LTGFAFGIAPTVEYGFLTDFLEAGFVGDCVET